MNDEIKRIQNLLDKYMDGATSNEEEATLRKYFEEHANEIPENGNPTAPSSAISDSNR